MHFFFTKIVYTFALDRRNGLNVYRFKENVQPVLVLNPLKRKEVNIGEYTALIKIWLRGNVRFHAVVELRRIFFYLFAC